MSDDWDFYICRVDDKLASIFVDLGIAREAPLLGRSHMAYVRVYMRRPRQDGLSSQEEYEDLIRLEDRLSAALTLTNAASYVGRNTSNGTRDFFFYTDDEDSWSQRTSTALTDFGEYKYEIGSRLDESWSTYFEFLYPSSADMGRIQNRRICESLRKNGDALVEARAIDHWAYFPSEDSRSRFVRGIVQNGFEIRGLLDRENERNSLGVRFSRIDLPSFENIDQITAPLHMAAAEAEGEYDGWETQVIR